MRLLFYGMNYAPEKTGTGKYTAEMAEWFAARGHEVHVITGPPHYPEWRIHEGFRNKHSYDLTNGVHVRRVPMFVPKGDVTPKQRIRMESSFSFHAARAWTKWALSRRKPDVIIAVCPPMQVGLPPRIFRALRKVPWVFHIQDLQVDAAVRLGMINLGRFVKALYSVEEKLLQRATVVSTITEGMAKRIQDKGIPDERIWRLPNWSDLAAMRPGPRNNGFRRELGLADSDILLLYAGNMGKKQGLEVILDAARLAEDPRLQFVLVGAGVARKNLEASAKALSNVRFIDLQPWERVPEMLNAADIHLIIQKREAADLVMPSKLTNVLAVGGCALGTAETGTLFDVLREVGYAVPPENPKALAKGILDLLDETRRAEMGRKARSWAEQHLNKETILARFEKQLASLPERRSPATPPQIRPL